MYGLVVSMAEQQSLKPKHDRVTFVAKSHPRAVQATAPSGAPWQSVADEHALPRPGSAPHTACGSPASSVASSHAFNVLVGCPPQLFPADTHCPFGPHWSGSGRPRDVSKHAMLGLSLQKSWQASPVAWQVGRAEATYPSQVVEKMPPKDALLQYSVMQYPLAQVPSPAHGWLGSVEHTVNRSAATGPARAGTA